MVKTVEESFEWLAEGYNLSFVPELQGQAETMATADLMATGRPWLQEPAFRLAREVVGLALIVVIVVSKSTVVR